MTTDHRKSVTSSLDAILKGEILSRLPYKPSLQNVEEMVTEARKRFAPNALWTIGALGVEYIDHEVRARLKEAFDEFRLAGGTLIVVLTDKPSIGTNFRVAAINAGNVPIKIAKTPKESNELSAAHRAANNKP